MIVEQKYRVRLSEIGRDNKVTNKSILSMLEDVASKHSDIAKFGIMEIPQTHLSWVLLDWKVEIIRRPDYGEEILARTWSRGSIKCYALRDFEVLDKEGNIIIKATSKWVLIDIQKEKIVRLDEELMAHYQTEPKCVFEEELNKLNVPQNYSSEAEYTVKKADIDINNHMHNINYLELVNEALPSEIYLNKQFNNFRITYKKEIKYGETVKCEYTYNENKHIIIIKNEDRTILHAIIELF